MATNDCDVLILGGGHNGLVCAAYLAKAGLRVTVLERRGVVGGCVVTEEFHPGFRNSSAAYTVSLLNPKVIRDLELGRHGLKIVERRAQNFLPSEGHGYLLTGEGRTAREVAKFSSRDAQRLEAYGRQLEVFADLLRAWVLETPPNVVDSGFLRALPELVRAARLGRKVKGLGLAQERELLKLFAASAGDYLDSWFESDPIKAVLGFDSVVGNYASPYSAGSAYVLLHHVFGEVNGKKGVWGQAIGGMGAITQAMARSAVERGARVRLDAAARQVIVEGGRAAGAVLASGEAVRAKAVASCVNPKLLFTELVPAKAVTEDFHTHMRNWRCGSGTFHVNVALSELPQFKCLPVIGDHHTAGIIMAPDLGYMERAYFDAKCRGWSREPIVEMLISSTMDDSLAPAGKHVASLFCQHAAPVLLGGASWDTHREEVADLMIATVGRYAPNFPQAVLGRKILSPLDLERTFGLTGGDIFHGALSLDQMFSARPALGYANYRTPLPGLYICGSGAHPGGGVTGAPGHNAAREILRDLKR
jgi:phytoene dehydrogenase-like protein